MQKKVRQADIAEKLGLSIVSVSKAIAGKEGVSKELREKIIETALEMGYIKSSPANNTTASTGIIGILVADRFFSDNTFYSNMYRSLLIKSTKAGYSAMLEIVTAESEQNCTMPQMISSGLVEGILFMGELSRDYLQTIRDTKLPCIMLDFYDDEIDEDSVCSDNLHGSYRITSHLIEQGCQQIGFVGAPLSTASIMDRYLGYRKALLRNNLSANPDWLIQDRNEAGRFIPLILPPTLPDAFVCSCDEVAYLLVNALQERGVRIPEDILVAGYDDYRYATICDPPLTTYHVNVDKMCETAISALIRKIRGKSYTQGCVVINGSFIIRKSTNRTQ